jgi:3-keto-disaccharide hydrolase
MRYVTAVCVMAGFALVATRPGNALALMAAQSALPAASEGWEPLFDGKSLDGWVARDGPDTNWHVDGGLLTAGPDTSRGYLVTTREFDNFQLKVDFWLNTGANSGVFLRVPGKDTPIDQRTAVEVNISDTHKTWPTGSINEIARVGVVPTTINTWNSYDITADCPHIVVKLNGVTTVDVQDTRHTSGPVGVQYCCNSGNVVKFKNIYIRKLSR